MGNSLIATSALAFAGALAAGPALAADKLSVGVGGYMQQWFGMASVDDSKNEVGDGVAQQSDSEIFFRGKLESDSGLTFSVKVELEGNSSDAADGKSTGVIDESQLTVGGSFGQITLGAEDPASTLMHYGAMDVGISLNCGDTHKWVGGLAGCSHNGFGTYGHGHGDKNQIMYFTPRMNGVQLGGSYIPDTGQEGSNNALNDNMKDAFAVGANYKGEFGDGLSVAFSVGHYQASQVGATKTVFDGMTRTQNADGTVTVTDSTYTETQRVADQADLDNFEEAKEQGGDFASLAPRALSAGNRMSPQQIDMAAMADDRTFSNAGLQVGMGAFTFTVAYATMDGGAYMFERKNRVVREDALWDHDGDGCIGTTDCTSGTFSTDNPGTAGVSENTQNNPANDIVLDVQVADESKNWDTWGTGVKYTDGPMAVSLSHLATEWDDGGEQAATMLSMSYTLAPGVASKTSVFVAERDEANGRSIEGTGFVTGIALSF